MNKVFWMKHENSELASWQQQLEQVTGSASFCVIPWIHLASRPNGDARICCVANASGSYSGDYSVGLVKKEDGDASNFGKELPSQIFNSEYMRSVRKVMLEGKIPSSCTKCFEEESKGIVSKRIWETGAWHLDKLDIPNLIKETEEDGSIPFKLQYLDLRLGNTCNLKCIMCSPHDSSMWTPEYKKVFPIFTSPLIKKQMLWNEDLHDNRWHENPKFWEEIYEQIPNIRQLYFAGGEPLIIKEHKAFLEEIVRRGYASQIHLRYNTNVLMLDEAIVKLWEKFKVVKVGVSLDALGDKNHYIRFPADWDTIVKNLHILDNTPDNIHVTIALAAQILNIKNIPDFIKWKVSSNFKKLNKQINASGYMQGGGLIGVHLLWLPSWLSMRVLPAKDKAEVREKFNELKVWLETYYKDSESLGDNPWGWKRWEGILDWMDKEDDTHLLPDFREYITTLDQQRKTDFKKTFPELAHLL